MTPTCFGSADATVNYSADTDSDRQLPESALWTGSGKNAPLAASGRACCLWCRVLRQSGTRLPSYLQGSAHASKILTLSQSPQVAPWVFVQVWLSLVWLSSEFHAMKCSRSTSCARLLKLRPRRARCCGLKRGFVWFLADEQSQSTYLYVLY
jgi:hypothetical protein